MIKLLNRKQYTLFAVLVAAIVIVVTIGNLQIIKNYPSGFDFIAHWQGVRTFISEGASPYSEQAAAEISMTIQEVNEPGGVGNYRFLTPLFSLIFYAPMALIKDAGVAAAIWMTFIEGVLIAAGLTMVRLGNWRRTLFVTILLFVYLMLSYPSVTTILSGNLAVVCLAMVIFALKAIRDGNDEAAGLLLGLSFCKPDAVILINILLIAWVIIQKRYRVIYWLVGFLILLFGFSILLIPDWPIQYFNTVFSHSFNNPIPGASGENGVALSDLSIRFSIVKNLIIAAILIVEWFIVKTKGYKRLYWLASITLAFGLWMGYRTPDDYLVFALPGFFFGLELISERWKTNSDGIVSGLVIILFIAQWIFSGFFTPEKPDLFPNWIVQVLIPGITLLLLYWSRWWVLHGKKLNEPDQFINL